MDDKLRQKLEKDAEIIEVLERYNKFLMEHGYTDSDVVSEEPQAIHQFIKEEGLRPVRSKVIDTPHFCNKYFDPINHTDMKCVPQCEECKLVEKHISQ